jgi:hypothetical protein
LGKPKLAFNWDGGPAEKVTIGATGGYRLQIEIEGLAARLLNSDGLTVEMKPEFFAD